MVNFRNFKKFRFLLISIFFLNIVHTGKCYYRLFVFISWLYFVLMRFNCSNLSSHRKMRKRTIYHYLIELVFKQILFHWQQILKLTYWKLTHIHNWTDIELINPMGRFTHSQNRSLTVTFTLIRNIFFLYLFFILLWIFLPIIKNWSLFAF